MERSRSLVAPVFKLRVSDEICFLASNQIVKERARSRRSMKKTGSACFCPEIPADAKPRFSAASVNLFGNLKNCSAGHYSDVPSVNRVASFCPRPDRRFRDRVRRARSQVQDNNPSPDRQPLAVIFPSGRLPCSRLLRIRWSAPCTGFSFHKPALRKKKPAGDEPAGMAIRAEAIVRSRTGATAEASGRRPSSR